MVYVQMYILNTVHKGALCQFPLWLIHYYYLVVNPTKRNQAKHISVQLMKIIRLRLFLPWGKFKSLILFCPGLSQSKCSLLLAIFPNQGGPRILIFGFAAISLTLSVVLFSQARAFCIITDDDGFSNWGQPYIP